MADIWFGSDHDDTFGALNVTPFGKHAPVCTLAISGRGRPALGDVRASQPLGARIRQVVAGARRPRAAVTCPLEGSSDPASGLPHCRGRSSAPVTPGSDDYYKHYRPDVFAEESLTAQAARPAGVGRHQWWQLRGLPQHALYWRRHGADVTDRDLHAPRSSLLSHWHPALDELTITTIDDLGDGDLPTSRSPPGGAPSTSSPMCALGTSWNSVQSIESRFYVER